MTIPIILIVEDDDDLRASVESVLTDRFYRVYAAPDGKAAMKMLQRGDWKPDLIVSDIMMPNMDGYEFFEAVHEHAELRSIPFIFLTALVSKADVQVGRRLGVDDYLVKPFEPDEFILAIENKIRRSQEMRQHAASELDDARRTMVQLLSHELRTPLMYMSGGVQLLAEEVAKLPLNETAQMSLGLVENGTTRLTRLVEEMIIYSQLAAGHLHVQLETSGAPAELNECVRGAIADLQPKIREKRIQVHVTLPDESLYIFGIGEMIGMSFGEVIRNAVAFSYDDGSIWVELVAVDAHATLRVTDQGCGIRAEDLSSVFKILTQSNRAKMEQQGAGMGLPIVKRVVEAHRGSVELESEEGRGTVVTIMLPLY